MARPLWWVLGTLALLSLYVNPVRAAHAATDWVSFSADKADCESYFRNLLPEAYKSLLQGKLERLIKDEDLEKIAQSQDPFVLERKGDSERAHLIDSLELLRKRAEKLPNYEAELRGELVAIAKGILSRRRGNFEEAAAIRATFLPATRRTLPWPKVDENGEMGSEFFAKDQNILVQYSYSEILITAISSGKTEQVPFESAQSLRWSGKHQLSSLELSPDGNFLVGRLKPSLSIVGKLEYSHRPAYIPELVHVWDRKTGKLLLWDELHGSVVTYVGFMPNAVALTQHFTGGAHKYQISEIPFDLLGPKAKGKRHHLKWIPVKEDGSKDLEKPLFLGADRFLTLHQDEIRTWERKGEAFELLGQTPIVWGPFEAWPQNRRRLHWIEEGKLLQFRTERPMFEKNKEFSVTGVLIPETGQVLGPFQTEAPDSIFRPIEYSATLSPSLKLLAVADIEGINLWDPAQNDTIGRLTYPEDIRAKVSKGMLRLSAIQFRDNERELMVMFRQMYKREGNEVLFYDLRKIEGVGR